MTSGPDASRYVAVPGALDLDRAPDRISAVNLGGRNPKPEQIGTNETYVDPDTGHVFYVRTRRFDGSVAREAFYGDSGLHRLGAPAMRWFYEDGSIELESYFRKNQDHRIDGPAQIHYDRNGKVTDSLYYFLGSETYSPVTNVAAVASLHEPEDVDAELLAGHFGRFVTDGRTPRDLLNLMLAGVFTLEGFIAVYEQGAPVEWVRAWEAGAR